MKHGQDKPRRYNLSGVPVFDRVPRPEELMAITIPRAPIQIELGYDYILSLVSEDGSRHRFYFVSNVSVPTSGVFLHFATRDDPEAHGIDRLVSVSDDDDPLMTFASNGSMRMSEILIGGVLRQEILTGTNELPEEIVHVPDSVMQEAREALGRRHN